MRRAVVRRGISGIGRLGTFSMKRMATEMYITDGTVVNTPIISGGPSAPLVLLGTTSQLADGRYATPFAMNFSFSQIQNYTELQAVFDYYRIKWVKVFVTYNHNSADPGSTRSLPSLYWVPDYDDNTWEGPGALRERMGLRKRDFTADRRCIRMMIAPRVQGAVVDNAGVFQASRSERSRMMDVQDPEVLHLGIKGYISGAKWVAAATAADIQSSFKFDVQFALTLRGLR